MIYGYSRVSSKGQDKYGNSSEAQEKLLRQNGATEIYYDSFTGMETDRENLNILVDKLQEGDILIVCKLDRLGRSLSKTSELINMLLDRGVTINILNLGVLSNDSVNTLLRNVLLAFAQFERDMIVERTQEGKEIARMREGYKEGRKPVDMVKVTLVKTLVDSGISVVNACKEVGIGRATYYKYAS
jgi:DNA invertase Pin-like site-specific DNA recombinase